jgi:hypothetical protein
MDAQLQADRAVAHPARPHCLGACAPLGGEESARAGSLGRPKVRAVFYGTKSCRVLSRVGRSIKYGNLRRETDPADW